MNVGMVTLYLSGDPTPDDDYHLSKVYPDTSEQVNSVLYVITFLNISGNRWKVFTVYFNCMIVVTSFTLIFIFKYMTKYQKFESTKD